MDSALTVTREDGAFAVTREGWYVPRGHLGNLDRFETDFVEIAERFVGTPYLWGGRSSFGIDCSGLVQTCLEAGGIRAPRDTDMMEAGIGEPLPLDAPLRRGDLIFWKGHVGIMLDAERLIHANGFWMQVSIEPLKLVDQRTRDRESLPIRTIKRI